MTRKKKLIILLVVIGLLLALAVLMSGLKIGKGFVTMPVSPHRVTEPGIYTLGEGRFLEVHSSEEGLEYLEGHEDKADSDSSFLETVSYSLRIIPSVRLEAGWSIEYTPPDQIKISTSSGEVVHRTFGADSPPLAPATVSGSVIRHKDSKDKQNKSEMATPRKPSD
jgi:hypothetical protein